MIRRVTLALLLLCAALLPSRAEERINRFISEIAIQKNGDLQVSETIDIWAEGRQVKRGILRDFPTIYHRADGSRVEIGFSVLGVTRDGTPEEYGTEKVLNGVRVRIGSAGRTLNTGLHSYVIRYRTTREIGFFKDFDEFYWNVTGNGWTFPIDMAEARISLPETAEFGKTAIYTGSQGARGQDARIVEQKPGRIVFRTTKALPVANGLTIAAAFPKGVVIEPTTMQKLTAAMQDEPALEAAAIGAPAVVLFYLIAWLLVGRDPPRGTIIPLFAPPAGMSAAAVRFVEDETFDDRVFAAAIVGLGVNGHLKLVDTGTTQELQKTKSDTKLDDAERAVATRLFAKQDTIELDKSDAEAVGGARADLWKALRRSYIGSHYRNNFVWSGIGLVGAVLVTSAILLGYSDSYGTSSATPGIFAGLLIPLIPVMIAVGLIRTAIERGGRHATGKIIAGLVLGVMGLAIGIAVLGYNIGYGLAMIPALVPSGLAALAAFGFSWLQSATPAGRKVMDQIEGFRQYLSVAEEDRLEYLNPPKKTPALFEKFLPYAIALDCENTWAIRFAGVLAAAGVGAAVSSWYVGDHFNANNVTSFTDRLGSTLPQTISSASSPPGSSGGGGGSDFASSGSSGGGSSGGGGGGGGGSGW